MKYAAFGLISLLFIAGCGQEQPVTYEAPKEKAAPPVQQMGSKADMDAVSAAHAAMNAHTPDVGFAAELPEGWTEKAGSGMRKVSYAIAGTSIDFYLISLTMGDVPSNVNRWRGQVGLPPASEDEIAADVQVLQADDHSVNYIEIYNDEGGTGIIAAIVDLAPKYWYFTAKGSVEELKAHASDIRSFLDSVKIN
ncbi:MAG: hypothetical protein KJN67_02185 [Pontiella sp.]|nr:hypothetical protein [Pontiella sp.]MBT8045952.1 hypothetical protein [Pontiella sp.]NNJ70796.1 hypothetical protein [Kiritimatiellales bacterium]